MSRWGYWIAGLFLVGCGEDSAPCADGQAAQIDGQAVCIFAQGHGIIENGFRCPPGRGEPRGMHDADGNEIVVCSEEPIDPDDFARAQGHPPPSEAEPSPMVEPEVPIEPQPDPMEETICDTGADASACEGDTVVWCADGVEKREDCADGCGMLEDGRFGCIEPAASICDEGPDASTCDGDVMRWCRGVERLLTCTFSCGDREGADPGCQPAGEAECRADATQLTDLINGYRMENGLPPLPCVGDIGAVGRAHAQDMCDRGYEDHTTPEGLMFDERLRAGGVISRLPGESIHRSGGQPLDVAFPDWIENDLGFADIIVREWRAVGAGVVECGDDSLWVINYVD